jgi:hypothetical protein
MNRRDFLKRASLLPAAPLAVRELLRQMEETRRIAQGESFSWLQHAGPGSTSEVPWNYGEVIGDTRDISRD